MTVVYDLHHAAEPPQHTKGLDEYQRMLQPYVTPGKGAINSSDRMNTLTITDTKENIGFVEKMLQLMHHADSPVVIEAKVVEVRWDKDLQIGVDGDLTGLATVWTQRPASEAALTDIRARFQPQAAIGSGAGFQGSTFRFNSTSSHRGTIGGVVQMFVERGKAQILSQPRIIVRSGEKATIFAGDEIAVPTNLTIGPAGPTTTFTYRPVGVTLEVTPHIVAPGQVILKLRPEVSSTFGAPIQIAPNTFAPQISVRRAETELLVRGDLDQEVVIGGLYRKEKVVIRRGIPFLSDIPILGYLFGRYEEDEVIQEILFYIKPTIIKDESLMPRDVFDPDKK